MKFEEFKTKVDHYNETVASLRKELAENLMATFQGLLEDLPNVVSFKFEAYTPYFNDGEPCVYRIGEVRVMFKDLSEEFLGKLEDPDSGVSVWDLGYTWKSGWGSERIFEEDHQKMGSTIVAIEEKVNSIPKDVMLAAFDDHKSITVSRDDVAIEHYDHD